MLSTAKHAGLAWRSAPHNVSVISNGRTVRAFRARPPKMRDQVRLFRKGLERWQNRRAVARMKLTEIAVHLRRPAG